MKENDDKSRDGTRKHGKMTSRCMWCSWPLRFGRTLGAVVGPLHSMTVECLRSMYFAAKAKKSWPDV